MVASDFYYAYLCFLKCTWGTTLVTQWLRICAPHAGLDPWSGNQIPRATAKAPARALLLSHVWLFGTHGLQPARLVCPRGFSGQEYWHGLLCPSLGGLPDPGVEPSLWHCRHILYHLSHQGSPVEGIIRAYSSTLNPNFPVVFLPKEFAQRILFYSTEIFSNEVVAI